TLDQLAQKYHLSLADTHAVAAGEPVLELGNGQDVKDEIFHLRQGDLSLPLRTDRGYVVLSLNLILPAHQGTLEEVRDKVVSELKQQKAKALGLDPKTSDPFARNGSVANLGSGKQLAAAFSLKVGQLGPPLNLSSNWAVYQVIDRQEANPADFEKQTKTITDTLLQQKRSLAFEAFRTSLDDRLKKDGKLKLFPEKMAAFGGSRIPGGLPISN